MSVFDHTAGRPAFETLDTASGSRGQRWLAKTLCIAALAASVAVLPAATAPMPAIPGFLAMNQCALVLAYSLTTWLFLAQYRRTGTLSVLVLGAGSLYTTLILLAQLVCFPNLVRPGLFLGTGAPTLTWLWNWWHLAPPLFALPYALLERNGRRRQTRPAAVPLLLWGTVTAALATAGAATLLSTRFVHSLPVMADPDGGYRVLTTSGVGPALIGLTALALAVLCWTTRLRSVLQLWLAVALFLLLLDNVVTAQGAARETMGWFVGRLEALLSALVVLGVYLWELDAIHRRVKAAALESEVARADAQSARDNLEVALDAAGMGDWELDLLTDITRTTLRHDRLFGYATPQVGWGRERFVQHVLPEDRPAAQAAFERALGDGKLDLECRIRRAGDGAQRWIAVQGRTHFDAESRPVSMAGCVLDVTDRRQTQERLHQAERMEAIGQLTGGVAHDFNNLLTVILGNLEMMTRRPGDAERVERLARSAFLAGRRGTELTDKLLAFSRRHVVRPETLNLNTLVTEFQPLLERAVNAPIRVELVLDACLDPVSLDAGQFQAALLNLAGNARDAMPAGGRLTLATSNVVLSGDDVLDLPGAKPGDCVRLAISDTGTGMEPATAARALEPFFTTKAVGKGTGLGLSQVFGFVQQAGGSCRIKTAPGAGCTVELFFPRSTEAASAVKPPSPAASQLRRAIGGEVVLIVEDEDAVREMAAESLQSLGYGVLTAPDARIALDILRGPSRIDILFSDVVMPGGMNGAQLAVAAREVRSDLKVLLTSGYTTTATGGARELPADVPLLRKPYLRADLERHFQSTLA